METIIILGNVEINGTIANINSIEEIYKSSTNLEHRAILECLETAKKKTIDTFIPEIHRGTITISKTALIKLLSHG
jgi:hypothetical protein